jgi:mono/diheme cytochrome c family protein
MRGLLLVFIVVAGCAQGHMESQPAQLPGPPLITAQDWHLTPGEALYFRHCADCHGWQGRGDGPVARLLAMKAPNLRQPAFQTDRSADELLDLVLHSAPLLASPRAAELTATEQDIDAIAAYLRRLPNLSWEQIEKGQQHYDTFCVACHGLYGRGDGPRVARLPTFPRDLSTADYQRQVSDAELLRIIAAGQGSMPGVGGLITTEPMQAITTYVRLLSPGYELYARFCAICHGVDGHPTALNPEAAWKNKIPPEGAPQVVFDHAYFQARSAAVIRHSIGHILQQNRVLMPHFDGGLSEDEVRQILSYLRSLPAERPRPSS